MSVPSTPRHFVPRSQTSRRVQKGERLTVVYRRRPAFRIVLIDDANGPIGELADDPLCRAAAVGASTDGRTAAQHDDVLYRK